MKGVVLALVLAGLPATTLSQTVVYPTGDPNQDVTAVRAAVEGGGTVLLKATDANGQPRAFEFGEFPVAGIDWDFSGASHVALGIWGEVVPLPVGGGQFIYVSIGNDVHLLGETTDGAMTTIRGGAIPIRNFARRAVPGAGEQAVYGVANLTVEGIRFSESALQSMYTFQFGWLPAVRELLEARGLEAAIDIRRNEFIDVQPAYDSFFGIWYALAAVTDGPAGSVHVEDNVVRFTSGRWDALERAFEIDHGLPPGFELWEGFSIADLNAPGRMARNSVRGVDVGLLIYFDGADVAQIVENRVELRPEGFVGIQAMANHAYLIERNTVIAAGAFPDGIVLWPSDPAVGINASTVRQNRVILSGSDFGGITLVGAGTANYVSDNSIEGSASTGLLLLADPFAPDALAVENTLAGNRLSRFVPRDTAFGAGFHVGFDTHTRYNALLGKSGIVLDLGEGNFVTGSATNRSGPGGVLARALAAKRDLLREVRMNASP